MAIQNKQKYTVENYGKERILIEDSLYLASRVSLMHTMFEINISALRQKLKLQFEHTNTKISLATALLYCYAQTLEKHKQTHALKSRNNKLYSFEEADIFFPYEIEVNGKKLIERKIILAANKKTMSELENEIANFALSKTVSLSALEIYFLSLPKWIRHFGYRLLMGNPLKRKEVLGNTYFSTAINLGTNKSTSYSVPIHFHSIGMFIMPCKLEEVMVQGKKLTKTSVCITVSADHAIINGMDLARFCKDFTLQIDALTF